MKRETIRFSAPGKIILFGEHAVVYGNPAIAIAIDKRVCCSLSQSQEKRNTLLVPDLFPEEQFNLSLKQNPKKLDALFYVYNRFKQYFSCNPNFNVRIHSSLPCSAGLGSSAATSVAFAKTLSSYFDNCMTLAEINKLAFEAETIQHGTPSGIDNTISTYGGGIFYQNGNIDCFSTYQFTGCIVVINSMIERSTKALVEKVRKLYDSNKSDVQQIFESISKIVYKGFKALQNNDLIELGKLMNENQILLKKIDVSHPKLDELLELLDAKGALGSKLTGAGGGGSVIGLFDDKILAKNAVITARDRGYQAFITEIDHDGVKADNE